MLVARSGTDGLKVAVVDPHAGPMKAGLDTGPIAEQLACCVEALGAADQRVQLTLLRLLAKWEAGRARTARARRRAGDIGCDRPPRTLARRAHGRQRAHRRLSRPLGRGGAAPPPGRRPPALRLVCLRHAL